MILPKADGMGCSIDARTTIQIRGEDRDVHVPPAVCRAQYFEAAATLRLDGDVRTDANAAGAVYVTNLGKQTASVEIMGAAGAGRKESLRPGEIKMLLTQNGLPEPT